MPNLKTLTLAAAASAALFLVAPTTGGAAPLSPPTFQANDNASIVQVAQKKKWRKHRAQRSDRRRAFYNRRAHTRWGHSHRRHYGWGGYRPHYGYYRPFAYGYRRPYCGYGYGYWGNCYPFGYGGPGLNLVFRF